MSPRTAVFIANATRSWARAAHLYCSAWVNSALHPFGVTKSSTGFGWGKAGMSPLPGGQVTLCDPIWHVSSRSGVAMLHRELLYPRTLLYCTLGLLLNI